MTAIRLCLIAAGILFTLAGIISAQPAQAQERGVSSPDRKLAPVVSPGQYNSTRNTLRPGGTRASHSQPAEVEPANRLPEAPESLPPGRRSAPPAESLALEDLEALALENNPSLGQAQAQVAAARGNLVQVGLYPNFELGYSGQQLGSGGRTEQNGVSVSQRFVTGGKLRLNRDIAAHEVARAEQVYVAQRSRVLTDVHVSFYDVLTAQRQLELAQDLMGIGEKAVGVAEALLKAKEGSRVDLLQAKVELDMAKILLVKATNQDQAAWRGLTAVMGTPGMVSQKLTGDLAANQPDIGWDEALGTLLSQSPEIFAALADVERARFALVRARRERIPDVTVQGVYQYDNDIQGRNGAINASIPVPLWDRNQGNILRAQAEIGAAERSVERIELSLQRRLAPVYQRYASAKQQAEKYAQDILPNAKSSLDLVRDGYSAGEFGFLNLLLAQRTYSQTNIAYVDALRELWSAAAEIRGLLLSDSLQDPK